MLGVVESQCWSKLLRPMGSDSAIVNRLIRANKWILCIEKVAVVLFPMGVTPFQDVYRANISLRGRACEMVGGSAVAVSDNEPIKVILDSRDKSQRHEGLVLLHDLDGVSNGY